MTDDRLAELDGLGYGPNHPVSELIAEVRRLRELLRPFATGHLYADEELRHPPDLDGYELNPYDPDRSPKVGDCRRAADYFAG